MAIRIPITEWIMRMAGIRYKQGTDKKAMLKDLAELFDKAESSIKVVAGELDYQAYSELAPHIKRALERGSDVEVIVWREADARSLAVIEELGIPLFVLDRRPDLHFAVADGKHVRLEEPHKQDEQVRTQYIDYDFKYAKQLESKFDTLKQQAQRGN